MTEDKEVISFTHKAEENKTVWTYFEDMTDIKLLMQCAITSPEVFLPPVEDFKGDIDQDKLLKVMEERWKLGNKPSKKATQRLKVIIKIRQLEPMDNKTVPSGFRIMNYNSIQRKLERAAFVTGDTVEGFGKSAWSEIHQGNLDTWRKLWTSLVDKHNPNNDWID